MDKSEVVHRLVEIRHEMLTLLEEAENLIRSEFPGIYPSASSYWLAHIESALGSDSYPTYSSTMQSDISEMKRDLTMEDDD